MLLWIGKGLDFELKLKSAGISPFSFPCSQICAVKLHLSAASTRHRLSSPQTPQNHKILSPFYLGNNFKVEIKWIWLENLNIFSSLYFIIPPMPLNVWNVSRERYPEGRVSFPFFSLSKISPSFFYEIVTESSI